MNEFSLGHDSHLTSTSPIPVLYQRIAGQAPQKPLQVLSGSSKQAGGGGGGGGGGSGGGVSSLSRHCVMAPKLFSSELVESLPQLAHQRNEGELQGFCFNGSVLF